MDNLTHALYVGFSLLAFVAAFTYSLFMVNKLNKTVDTIVYKIDKTNYYDYYSLEEELVFDNDEVTNKAYKVVGLDSIIPTLYRYAKESFCVKILDERGNLLQLFDTTVESAVMAATEKAENKRTNEERALLSLYGDPDANGNNYGREGDYRACNMFGAPWLGSTNEDSKERIDLYINGGKGYINNTWVDYTIEYEGYSLNSNGNDHELEENKIYLNNFRNRKFKEIFSEYSYEGDTLTTEDDEFITLTGTKQSLKKIIVNYQLLPVEED